MEILLAIIFGLLSLTGISIYGLFLRAREILTADIRNLLEDCRRLSSWDERSEYKLLSWIHGSERELHSKSVRELLEVRNNMQEYYRIHYNMAGADPFGEEFDMYAPVSLGVFFIREIFGFYKFGRNKQGVPTRRSTTTAHKVRRG